MSTVTIEIDGPLNESLHFRPLGETVRGRLDLMRDSEPMAKIAAGDWPPVPGQRLGYDFDRRVGFVEEPLQEPDWAALRKRLEGKGYAIPEARREFADQDLATWVFWLQAAVRSGVARVVAGKLPTKLPGEPRRNFLLAESPARPDRLVAALERQNELLERLAGKLGA